MTHELGKRLGKHIVPQTTSSIARCLYNDGVV